MQKNPENINQKINEFNMVSDHIESIEPAIQNLIFDHLYDKNKNELEKLFYLIFNSLKTTFKDITKDNIEIDSNIYLLDQKYVIVNIGNTYLLAITDYDMELTYEPAIKLRLSQFNEDDINEYKMIWTNYIGICNILKL